MDTVLKTAPYRTPEFPVEPLFPERWSRRALSGAHIDKGALMTLFEAARWAPSSRNAQPWRFVYALRGTPAWTRFLALLTPRNKSWCIHAGALILIASRRDFESDGKPNKNHSFDAGAAWMSLALQASLLGWVAHGMAGFDYGAAAELIELPDGYAVEAMCAVGYPGPLENLDEDQRARETPSARKSVPEFAFEARFPAPPPA